MRGRTPAPVTKVRRGGRLSDELRSAREKRGFSQERLARSAGVSTAAVRRIEDKITHEPGFFTVVDMAQALGLSLPKLAKGTNRARS